MAEYKRMTGAELEAVRMSSFLSRDEFAELTKITPFELRQYEAGHKPVPDRVAMFALDMLEWKLKEVAALEKAIDRAQRKMPHTELRLLWYGREEDFTSLKGNRPAFFRVHQSVIAEYAICENIRLVRFDAKAYNEWRKANKKRDKATVRAEWSNLQEI